MPKVWTFDPTLKPIYPLKMAQIAENKNIEDENSANGLSKSVNPTPVALLPFKLKIGLLFALFECFLVKKEAWSQFKGPESKSHLAMLEPQFLGSRISKGFGPTISWPCVLWS